MVEGCRKKGLTGGPPAGAALARPVPRAAGKVGDATISAA